MLWIPVSLFSLLLLSWPNGLMSKVAIVAGLEVMCGLRNMDVHSPRPTWLWPLLTPSLPAAENSTLCPVRHHLLGWSASSLVVFGLLPSWTGHCFVRNGVDLYSGYRFAFQTCNVSATTAIGGLSTMVFHTALLWSGNSLHRQWSGSGPMLMEFNGPAMFCTILGQLYRWNSRRPLEDAATTLARRQYLAGLGQGSPEGCACSAAVPNT